MKRHARLLDFRHATIEPRQHLIQTPARLVGDPLQTALRGGQAILDAVQTLQGLGHGLQDLSGVEQEGAALGQFLLLALLGVERFEFAQCVAQEILVAAGFLQCRRRFGARPLGLPPGGVALAQRGHVARQPGKGVQGRAVGFGIHQSTLLEMALHLDQGLA